MAEEMQDKEVLSGELIADCCDMSAIDNDPIAISSMAIEIKDAIDAIAEAGDYKLLNLVAGLLEDDWTDSGVYEALEAALGKAYELQEVRPLV